MKQTLVLLLALISFNCKVTLVPSYSSEAVAKVEAASMATDKLYNDMIAAADKTFSTYENRYAGILVQINDILVLDSSRNKSKIILIIANDIHDRQVKYAKVHESSVTLNHAELQTFRDYMHALWESLHNAEINFKP